MKDLVVLIADGQMKAALEPLLERHAALGIRHIQAKCFAHPRHDPGVLNEAGEFLSIHRDQYHGALVLFDREGCGQEDKTAGDLEQQVQQQLDSKGWKDRSAVIVLDPELEIWVWSDSPHVAEVLGVPARELHSMVAKATRPVCAKPDNPKQLLEDALRQAGIPKSSSLFAALAQKVSLNRCTDRAFLRLKQVLQRWFPQ